MTRTRAGTLRRFDSIWVSRHFRVTGVDDPFDQCIEAARDHSAVVVDLELAAAGRPPGRSWRFGLPCPKCWYNVPMANLPHKVLGLPDNSSPEEVRAAYKVRAQISTRTDSIVRTMLCDLRPSGGCRRSTRPTGS